MVESGVLLDNPIIMLSAYLNLRYTDRSHLAFEFSKKNQYTRQRVCIRCARVLVQWELGFRGHLRAGALNLRDIQTRIGWGLPPLNGLSAQLLLHKHMSLTSSDTGPDYTCVQSTTYWVLHLPLNRGQGGAKAPGLPTLSSFLLALWELTAALL